MDKKLLFPDFPIFATIPRHEIGTESIDKEIIMIQTLASPRNKTSFGNDSERIRLLYHDELSGGDCWETLEEIREMTHDGDGQFISLDLTELQGESLPAVFYAALKKARWEQSLPFSLPGILRQNFQAASPFINRAILWQRLCDLLIIDDESDRETVLVLEYIDQASTATQHDIARLIRFHETYSITRTFVFTLDHYTHGRIIPELRQIFDI